MCVVINGVVVTDKEIRDSEAIRSVGQVEGFGQ